jgi:hypothetical protein
MDINNFISFVIGVIVGFTLFYIFGAEKEGDNPKIGFNMIFYFGGKNCIHIHHWVIFLIFALIITIVVRFGGFYFNPVILFLYGLLLGASLEDLRYKDFLKFKIKCY